MLYVDTEGGDPFVLQYSYRTPSEKNVETNIGKSSVAGLRLFFYKVF